MKNANRFLQFQDELQIAKNKLREFQQSFLMNPVEALKVFDKNVYEWAAIAHVYEQERKIIWELCDSNKPSEEELNRVLRKYKEARMSFLKHHSETPTAFPDLMFRSHMDSCIQKAYLSFLKNVELFL